jgi:hypothetical protein
VSAVIRLDLMLREAVTTPYRDLVTRPTGVAVRRRVLLALGGTGDSDALLDFSEVGLVDFSCADEVVAKLMTDAALPGRRVILRGLRDDQAEAIEHALARQGLVTVVLSQEGGGPRLIGAVSDDGRAAFAAVVELGRTPIPPVADHLAWEAERAARALQRLARQRCLREHPDATYECGELA